MTSFEKKCEILSDLWVQYRTDEGFKDFIEYNDLGLPMAHFAHKNYVTLNESSEAFISETFDLLLAGLKMEDTGFENLEDLLNSTPDED